MNIDQSVYDWYRDPKFTWYTRPKELGPRRVECAVFRHGGRRNTHVDVFGAVPARRRVWRRVYRRHRLAAAARDGGPGDRRAARFRDSGRRRAVRVSSRLVADHGAHGVRLSRIRRPGPHGADRAADAVERARGGVAGRLGDGRAGGRVLCADSVDRLDVCLPRAAGERAGRRVEADAAKRGGARGARCCWCAGRFISWPAGLRRRSRRWSTA